jgi:CRISPR-associated protein (TIGR03986 family)
MAFPRQVRPAANKAVAPYNFVPVPEKVYVPAEAPVDHSCFMADRHSGTLDISVTTETKLYTRAAVSPEYAAEHPEQHPAIWQDRSQYREFFHHGDLRPVIPGSTLRGLIRQAVEVMADGTLSTELRDGLVYRAVGDRTHFGRFYRRRFVGPNTDLRNAHKGMPIADPDDLPQTLEYPVRIPDATDPWKQNAVHGGYLRSNGSDWHIVPALRHPAGSEESFVHVPTNLLPASLQNFMPQKNRHFPVWVKPSARAGHNHKGGELVLVHAVTTDPVHHRFAGGAPPAVPGYEPAWLVLTGSLTNHGQPDKHMHCAIFEPDLGDRPLAVPRSMQQTYRDDEKMRKLQGADRRGRVLPPALPDPIPGSTTDQSQVFPVWYMVNAAGELVYFGPTFFFRLPYRQPPAAFAGPQEVDDLACRIFGRVRGARRSPAGEPQAVKGRLRFEDLAVTEPRQDLFEDYVTPSLMLGPKPTSIQTYLVQPDAAELRHYDDPSWFDAPQHPRSTVLRGFKFYWHKPGYQDPGTRQPASVVQDGERKTRTVLRPVRPQVTFRGRIHFENLSSVELGGLLVALELQPHIPTGDRTLRHKVGMARKHGFGSVRIEVERFTPVAAERRYGAFFEGDVMARGERPDSDDVRTQAVIDFAAEMAAHRDQPLGAKPDIQKALDAFWRTPRMRELAALLDWKNAPGPQQTREIEVQGQPGLQWRHRYVLPPPHQLMNNWADPWAPTPGNLGAPLPPPIQHEWTGVILERNPGQGSFRISYQKNQTAVVSGPRAQAIEAALGLSKEAWKKKGQQVKVNATVEQSGNQWIIVKVALV